MEKDVGGRPSKLDDAMIEKVVDAVKRVLVLRHVAGLCKIHFTSIYNWLEQAQADLKENQDTIHVRFFYALKNAQAEKVQEMLDAIATRVNNWQANAWILERCFREDFGSDAGVIQELLDKQGNLESLLTRYLEGNGNGRS
jgi:hypothetical protein